MSEPIDDLDRHLARAGSIERAAVPLGMYLAWCGNLHLVNAAFQQAHEGALLRLRYREISPAEFLVASSGGTISPADLTAEGAAFAASYYGRYLDDFRETFAGDIYSVKDDWAHYDQIAAVLTSRFMAMKQAEDGRRRHGNRAADGSARKWWQVWR